MSNHILKHVTGLIRNWASRYFARLPTRYAESGSLTLCTAHFLSLPSDPAVTSNALAIRIVFPLIRVTPALRRLGLPAMPGKQKKGFRNPETLLLNINLLMRAIRSSVQPAFPEPRIHPPSPTVPLTPLPKPELPELQELQSGPGCNPASRYP